MAWTSTFGSFRSRPNLLNISRKESDSGCLAMSSPPDLPRLRRPLGRIVRARPASIEENQPLGSIKHQTGQAADRHAVEADILQVLADVHLDQPCQLGQIPALDLVGDEFGHAALLAFDEGGKRDDEALVHVGPDLRI